MKVKIELELEDANLLSTALILLPLFEHGWKDKVLKSWEQSRKIIEGEIDKVRLNEFLEGVPEK